MLKQLVNNLFTAWADGLCSFSRAFGRQAWLAFLVVFSLIVSVLLTPASAQTGLSDIEGLWAQPCIEELIQRQIISGYPDGSFKPDDPVTRAEFATMIGKAFPNVATVRESVRFVDIPSNYWAASAISNAYQTGFLSGYIGRAFNPVLKITREQVLVALASGLKYSPTQPVDATLNGVFDDAQKIPNNARNAIAAATEQQLVVNYPDVRTLNPNQLVSRGEIAAFFCQAMGISGVVPSQYIAKIGSQTTPTTEEQTPITPTAPITPIPTGTEEQTPTAPTPPPLSVAPTTEEKTRTTPTLQRLQTPQTTPIPTSEIRGVWLTNIDSDVLFSPSRLNSALENLHQLNFNTIYPTVWNWGYTLYPSTVARGTIGRSRDPEIGLRGRDIVKEIIDRGHQNGLAVIPWFEFGFMAPADSELAKRYPNWILKRSDGTEIWKEGPHDRVWLNPFHPEVQQFIEDLIVELVTKYDIDGIQFDDHFGFPSEFGYDSFTVALYQQEHAGQSPPADFKDPEWIRWRAEKITEYMKRVHRAIKERKPNALVSISPNPQEFSYKFYLADWATWEQQGMIDELILQVYRNDINRFIGELEQPEVQTARSRIPVGIGIMTGVKPQFVPIPQIQEQVQAVRERNFAGVSFFFYESLWTLTKEPSAERKSAIATLFPNSAKRPNMLVNRQPSS